MYYFLPSKSIFACISTYIHSKIFPCEGSNPARDLKCPNVIYENRSKFYEIWVAKKPNISGFFGHVINFVMPIWLGWKDLNPRNNGVRVRCLTIINFVMPIWLGWKDLNPRNNGVRVRCLTTWRHPNVCTELFSFIIISLSEAIVNR